MTPPIEDFVAGRAKVGPNEGAAWAAERRDLGSSNRFFFSCTRFCFEDTKTGYASANR